MRKWARLQTCGLDLCTHRRTSLVSCRNDPLSVLAVLFTGRWRRRQVIPRLQHWVGRSRWRGRRRGQRRRARAPGVQCAVGARKEKPRPGPCLARFECAAHEWGADGGNGTSGGGTAYGIGGGEYPPVASRRPWAEGVRRRRLRAAAMQGVPCAEVYRTVEQYTQRRERHTPVAIVALDLVPCFHCGATHCPDPRAFTSRPQGGRIRESVPDGEEWGRGRMTPRRAEVGRLSSHNRPHLPRRPRDDGRVCAERRCGKRSCGKGMPARRCRRCRRAEAQRGW